MTGPQGMGPLQPMASVTVTIDQAPLQEDPTSSSTIKFNVHFSVPVTGFGIADVTLSGTAGADTVGVSGVGEDYIVTVSGMIYTGTVIATIPAGVATSASGVSNSASTSTDNTVTWQALDTLAHWWDFSDVSTITYSGVGATVQQIDDKIGTAHASAPNNDPNVSVLGTLPAVNSYGVSGSSDNRLAYMAASIIDLPQPCSLAFVGGRRNTGGFPGGGTWLDIVQNGHPNNTISLGYLTFPSAGTLFWRNLKTGPAQLSLAGNPLPLFQHPYAFVLILDGANSALYCNGTLIESFTANVLATINHITFFNTQDTNDGHDLFIGECQVGPGVVTNLAALSLQLFWKWLGDPDKPTVTINQAIDQDDPTEVGGQVFFDVEFSEDVFEFSAADVAFSGTAGATTAIVTGSGSTYTVEATGMTSSGTVTAVIPAGGATAGSGKTNAASTSTDNTVTYTIGPSGGTITKSGGYTYHTFSTVGTHEFNPNGYTLDIDYCVVAGGGGGAKNSSNGDGAGGAGGGVRTGSTTISTPQTVIVGARGLGMRFNTPTRNSTNGGNSSLGSIASCTGGGRGQANGGSGGGGAYSAGASVGTGTAGEGNNGGTGASFGGPNTPGGGGGGGAGGTGTNGSTSAAGNGGPGIEWPTGSGNYYGPGGGGGRYFNGARVGGDGGLGGGGNGGTRAVLATSGAAGKGAGGGAGGAGDGSAGAAGANGGDGSDGAVIIRYLTL